jgi:signal transduction histidine kinase
LTPGPVQTEPLDPRRVSLRIGLIQATMTAIVWFLLLLWNSRQIWLLEPDQALLLQNFLLWQLPALGLLPLVVLPAYWAFRLADEACLAVTHETEFLNRLLAYPREVAVVGMAASAIIFFFGALRLRVRAGAPALEAAKLEVLGFVVGVLIGILSYFLLQSAIRPALAAAVAQGAVPTSKTAFPVWQKLFVCCLGVAFIVFGLFGQLALTWAERFSEAKSEEMARARLRTIAGQAQSTAPRDALQWRKLLAETVSRTQPGTIAVLDTYGRKVATLPERPSGVDAEILSSEELRERLGLLGNGSTVLRRGVTRVATSLALGDGRRVVALTPPDARIVRELLVSIGVIAAEVLALSILLAAAVGRGLTRPLQELEAQTRAFARNPDTAQGEAVPTDDEIGALTRAFSSMRAEVVRVQTQLRLTERRAATAELLAGVAHEVRNPLFGITSTLAALEGELGIDTRFERYFEVVKKEGARLARMMEEMLALQRAPRATPRSVQIEPLLQACADWARATFPGRMEKIEVSCADGLTLPHADEEGLRSVLTNLVENAAYSADHPVIVRLSGDRTPSGVVIRVEDNGIGVDPALRDRIFEPFVSGRSGGTGMGLALCRQIVHENKGEISFSPGVENGTIFTISLPDLRG